jgi:3-hydroxyacyl-[acyl-carrier-protein] dehydratase
MMDDKYIFPPENFAALDVVRSIEEIRKFVPQRFEFEMLSGILHLDVENQICVGFQDVPKEPFWMRGHIPDRPLMPGVLIVETAAQLCTYCYKSTHDDPRFMGFGGIDAVKFRGTVLPGNRLIMVSKAVELRSRRMIFNTQGFVEAKTVYEGTIIGMAV